MRDLLTLPKTHLHLHFEGSARPKTADEIYRRSGRTFNRPERWDSFAQFNDAYADFVNVIDDLSDLERIAREIVEDDAAGGVRYIEPIFLPHGYDERFGVSTDEVFWAITNAFRAAAEPYGIEVGFQIAGIFHFGPEHMEMTARYAVEMQGAGVVAYNLCGIEPLDYLPFMRAIDIARDGGLRIIPHAGEFGPAANVRSAIELIEADRICHGVKAIQEPAVLDLLAAAGVCCDICPTSNEVLQVFPAFEDSPIPTFLERDIPFTLNADDSLFVGGGVGYEYARVAEVFGLSDSEMANLARISVTSSFAPAAVKERILVEIDDWEAAEN